MCGFENMAVLMGPSERICTLGSAGNQQRHRRTPAGCGWARSADLASEIRGLRFRSRPS